MIIIANFHLKLISISFRSLRALDLNLHFEIRIARRDNNPYATQRIQNGVGSRSQCSRRRTLSSTPLPFLDQRSGAGVADVTLGNVRRHSTGPRSCPNGSMSEEETSEKFNGRCGVTVLLLLFDDEAERPSLIASEYRSEIPSFVT